MKNQFTRPKLLKIILDESEHVSFKSLYEEIVFEAKEFGMAGATVMKGIMNFGSDKEISTFKIFSIAQELPIIIEIIDDGDKIDSFVIKLDEVFERNVAGGLLATHDLDTVKHYPQKQK
ncbi:MAG: DUF190 domain-containing protein [Flavobacteriales bacterium]|nr:DUF190 domain-containing protein [Flavobacteriales bacterium]